MTGSHHAEDVQGTAASPDGRAIEAGSGDAWSVLLDDGSRLPVAPGALAAGGLRRVRPGQRLRLRLAEEPEGATAVVAVTLPTAPWPPAEDLAEGSMGT